MSIFTDHAAKSKLALAALEAEQARYEASPEYAEDVAHEASVIAAHRAEVDRDYAALVRAQKAERAAQYCEVRAPYSGRVLATFKAAPAVTIGRTEPHITF